MISTDRLLLRPWRKADLEPFARLNADRRVMEYFPAILTREESDRFVERVRLAMEEQGWGLWAVSVPDLSDFIGYIGLAPVRFEAAFTPAVEVGWRLAFDFWNHGYATEGARAALRYGFDVIGLAEIVSFTALQNGRSRRVMEKIGLLYQGDFDHPALPEGDPLKRHALYRLARPASFL